MRWSLIEVLICVSLMINDVECLLISCWTFVCLPWKNACSGLLSIFKLGYLILSYLFLYIPFIFQIYFPPYQIFCLYIFFSIP
jgi:hypothetical protein